jgi:hypothetical protein
LEEGTTMITIMTMDMITITREDMLTPTTQRLHQRREDAAVTTMTMTMVMAHNLETLMLMQLSCTPSET